MKVINTEKAPGAIGPYSQGFVVGNLVITSGQIPVNPADGSVGEGIAAQAEQSCKNVGAILEAAGSVRQVFHLQARPQLRGRQDPAQECPVRDRGYR